MSYIAVNPRRITAPFPHVLSGRSTSASNTVSGASYDYRIAGYPFMLAVGVERPYRRSTLDSQRQQIDTADLPGEHTLSQWWTRTQSSWHIGAGVQYYEPGSDEGTVSRFRRSVGLDPWTRGELKLLRKTDLLAASGGVSYVTGAVVGSDSVVFYNNNGTVSRSTATTPTAYSGGTLAPSNRIAVCGTKIVVGTTGSLLIGNANGNTLANMVSAGSTTYPMVPYWVKSRLIATRGPEIYDYTLASVALGTPLYTHPDTGFSWTAVSEAPDAILSAGNSAVGGSIYAFILDDAGGSTPALGAGFQVAEFPPGEFVHSMQVYLGQYVAIGTSRGLRIGLLGQGGQIQYGPLIIETVYPVTAITAADRFVYAASKNLIDGYSGCVRVDLSQPAEQDLRFAYALDAQTHVTGDVQGLTLLGTSGRLVFGVSGSGVYLQSDDEYEQTGYLETGRVRYDTTASKAFMNVNVQADTPRTEDDDTTAIRIASINPHTTEYASEFRVTDAYEQTNQIQLSTKYSQLQWIELKFTLESNDDGSDTPVLHSWTLLSLPHVRAQRGMQVPLQCYDFESDRNGVQVGYLGAAYERLRALETAEEENIIVTVQDFTTGESFQGLIRGIQFEGRKAPQGHSTGFGGTLDVTVVKL